MDDVVISATGLVSPAGHDLAALAAALARGAPCLQEIRAFDASPFAARSAAVTDLDPATYLGAKGLRTLDRPVKMALVAGHLVYTDAGLLPTTTPTASGSGVGPAAGAPIGLALGNSYGAMTAQGEFDRETLSSGPTNVNPSRFPYVVWNAAAGAVAIRFGGSGPNLTLTAGPVSSLDAVALAADFVRWDRCEHMLAGGVEGLTFDQMLHFDKLRILGSDAPGASRRPYDPASTGVIAGEAACLFLVERAASARSAGRTPRAVIRGADSFLADDDTMAERAAAVARACRGALDAAGLAPAQLDLVVASANGLPSLDAAELQGLRSVLEGADAAIAVPKAVVGECFSASGALQIATALIAFSAPSGGATLPLLDGGSAPTIALAVPARAPQTALCVALGWDGQASAIVLSK